MDFELLFSVAGAVAMAGWLVLIASPFIPKWSDKIAGWIVPGLLSGGYVVLAVFFSGDAEGGFGSFGDIVELFSHEEALLALWVHVLAFDLVIGAWMCRTARLDELNFWLVIPCLLLTFLFGPAGFLAFSLLRVLARKLSPPG